MKTHLFRPKLEADGCRTMCGLSLREFSVWEPSLVTCKSCLRLYVGKEQWYSAQMTWHNIIRIPNKPAPLFLDTPEYDYGTSAAGAFEAMAVVFFIVLALLLGIYFGIQWS